MITATENLSAKAAPNPHRLPPVLEDAMTRMKTVAADGSIIPLDSNVSREEALQLYGVVRALRPLCSVEVGYAYGVSGVTILQALEDNGVGTHHGIDPFQSAQWKNAGVKLAERAGLRQRLIFHEKFAEEIVPSLPPVDFGFIDASHLFDLTLMEFILIDKKLSIGGIIGFHDLWMPSLRKVVRYILKNRAYRLYTEVPGQEAPPPDMAQKLKQAISGLLQRVPGSPRFLRPELLEPSSTLGVRNNLVFIQKLAADERDWRFHADF